ncbi:hypothetical protein H7Y63_00265 [Polaromonas sp.]|nr:hypothetical protein [Candidatus Saccharibacteria bacterium]
MKKFMAIGCGVLLLTVLFAGGQSPKVAAVGLTCDATGQVVMPAAVLTSAEVSAASSASAWLKAQTNPRNLAITASTITPATQYYANYTGAVSGTFALTGVSYPTISTTSILVDTPSTLADNYRGLVTGHLRTPLPSGPTTIQAYKFTDIDYYAPASASVANDGTWTLDLSAVPNNQAGAFHLGLIDDASTTQVGDKWPQPVIYSNLVVRSYAYTDANYLISEQPALANNTWSFPSSALGYKEFRLVDTTNGNVIADTAYSSGLIRSYKIAPGEPGYGTNFEDRSFVYDQAIALLAAIGTNDTAQARVLVNGLLTLQTTGGLHDGGFIFSAPQRGPDYGDAIYRTGAHSIATYALLSYVAHNPTDPSINILKVDAARAMQFLQSVFAPAGDTTGLYHGGFGRYDGNGVFVGGFTIPWSSTEHNIDTWHTLVLAASVLQNPAYIVKATSLQQAIATYLWNPSLNRFNQGYDAGAPDTSDALDVNSWGAIYAGAVGDSSGAAKLLLNMSNFAFTRPQASGYAPYVDALGYPGALPNVWFEGTFGAALGFLRNGQVDNYATTLQLALPAQHPDGAFSYATDYDATYEMTTSEAVASTAWYVLATTARTAIWNECIYTPPSATPIVTPIPPPTPTAQPPATPVKTTATPTTTTSAPAANNTVAISPTGVPSSSVVPPPVPLAAVDRPVEPAIAGGSATTKTEDASNLLVAAIKIGIGGLVGITAILGLVKVGVFSGPRRS